MLSLFFFGKEEKKNSPQRRKDAKESGRAWGKRQKKKLSGKEYGKKGGLEEDTLGTADYADCAG